MATFPRGVSEVALPIGSLTNPGVLEENKIKQRRRIYSTCHGRWGRDALMGIPAQWIWKGFPSTLQDLLDSG